MECCSRPASYTVLQLAVGRLHQMWCESIGQPDMTVGYRFVSDFLSTTNQLDRNIADW